MLRSFAGVPLLLIIIMVIIVIITITITITVTIIIIIMIIIIIIIIIGSANHPLLAVLRTELRKGAAHDIRVEAWPGSQWWEAL